MKANILVVTTLLLTACVPMSDAGLENHAHVMVHGNAQIEAVPDELMVRLSVEATDENLTTANDSVAQRVNAALDAIRAAGVPDTDLRALGIQISPVYDWVERQQVFRGHRVSRSIEFKLGELGKWPALVESLVSARVDRIDSVVPGHSQADRLKRDALRDAVADARDRATVLAEAADSALGRVWTISELDRGFAAPRAEAMMMRSADAGGAAQWEAGTITISSTVQATFLMEHR